MANQRVVISKEISQYLQIACLITVNFCLAERCDIHEKLYSISYYRDNTSRYPHLNKMTRDEDIMEFRSICRGSIPHETSKANMISIYITDLIYHHFQ